VTTEAGGALYGAGSFPGAFESIAVRFPRFRRVTIRGMRRTALFPLILVPVLLAFVLGVRAEEKTEEPPISKQLDSRDPAVRERASVRLGEQGDVAATKKLIALLEDPDWGVRLAATKALAPIRSTKGRAALIDQMRTGDFRVLRLTTAKLLAGLDDKSVAWEAAKGMSRFEDEQRVRLIEALGVLGTPYAAKTLAKQMRSPDVAYRKAAVRALGEIGAGIDVLIDALRDKEEEVQWLAAVAIAGIDSQAGRKAVVDWIDDARDPVPGWVLRRFGRRGAAVDKEALEEAVAAALERTRRARSLLLLAWTGRLDGCAEAARRYFRARDAETRALALSVAGLGEGGVEWKRAKRALRNKHKVVRHAAARAYLSSSSNPEEALERILRNRSGDVVLLGVQFAVDNRRRDALPHLVAVASGETAAKRSREARAAACVALGRIGRGDAFDSLVELAEDRAWQVRAAALEGLTYVWKKEAIPVFLKYYGDFHSVTRKVARRNLRYMVGRELASKSDYESWWEEHGPKFELVHPDELRKKKEKERDKYGYAIDPRRYMKKILGDTEILVVRGRWDFVEKVLTELEVEHTAVFAQKVKDLGVTPKQVVLVNCEGTTDSETTEYLRWFVVTGGYMATTDWALVNALNRTFPNVIGKYARQSTGNDVVIVQPGKPDSRLLEGAFPFGVQPKWWLEIQAFPIVLDDPVRSEVLVDSFQMLTRYGSSPMLVEFRGGLGRVIHSTSHFFLAKEGFSSFGSPEERKIFAVDHLGVSIDDLRKLEKRRFFENMSDTTPISRNYSMFVMLVNFIREKQARDLDLR